MPEEVPNARVSCRLLQLMMEDSDEALREVCHRPAIADMLQALDAGDSSPTGCAEAWIVLVALANAGVSLADHHAEPPLDEFPSNDDDQRLDEAVVRRRLTTVVKRGMQSYETCVHPVPCRVASPREYSGSLGGSRWWWDWDSTVSVGVFIAAFVQRTADNAQYRHHGVDATSFSPSSTEGLRRSSLVRRLCASRTCFRVAR